MAHDTGSANSNSSNPSPPLSPFQQLPNEMLSLIFEPACMDNLIQEYPWPLFWEEPPTQLTLPAIAYLPALAISAVCTRWRSLALSSPGIWSQFRLEIAPIAPKPEMMHMLNARSGLISTLQLYLDRSADSPLIIDLQTPMGAQSDQSKPSVLGLLLGHTSRWKTFTYTGDLDLSSCGDLSRPPSFPILEDLILRGSDVEIQDTDLDCFQHAPKLRAVKTDELDRWLSKLPWTQLTSLDVGAPRGEDIELLHQCPSLTVLKLRSFWSKFGPGSVSLAILESFTFIHFTHMDTSRSLETMFSVFTFPSLGELIICSEDGSTSNLIWPPDAFSAFISRSACTLTTLSLSRVTISDLDLVTTLNLLPSLINFSVDGLVNPEGGSPISFHFLSSLTLHDSGSPLELIPKLRFLSIKLHGTEFDDVAFARMVSSRWLPNRTQAAATG
ncbi:hypothetical protein BT96DRAFT_985249 [Gymnopus androsaceus JB14]|uniref:Uncharacterized protein n=1 Tax=Gymnopus androsaceus JB14 TaxID=1447944 RepID=A0A6A4IE99_9AGAR|nr:hypothetical protein BT96DRAFT_985249 [Gymnopus androsaceus JB14]